MIYKITHSSKLAHEMVTWKFNDQYMQKQKTGKKSNWLHRVTLLYFRRLRFLKNYWKSSFPLIMYGFCSNNAICSTYHSFVIFFILTWNTCCFKSNLKQISKCCLPKESMTFVLYSSKHDEFIFPSLCRILLGWYCQKKILLKVGDWEKKDIKEGEDQLRGCLWGYQNFCIL